MKFSLRVLAGLSFFLLFSRMIFLHDPATVQIMKDVVLVNGEALSKDWKVSTVYSLLGKPDSVSGDAHPDAMYEHFDDGIRYWQRNCREMGNYVEEIKFYISRETDAYSGVHSAFNGLVVLNGTAIDSTTSLDKMRKILSGWRNCNAYSANTYEFMTDVNFIFFEYSPDQRKLLWISVGKRTSIISGCD